MSVSVEEQIRMLGSALEQFVGDVDVDEVIGRAEPAPVTQPANGPDSPNSTTVLPGHRRTHEYSTRPRIGQRSRRQATLVAAVLVAVIGIVGMVTVAQRPVDAPSDPRTPPVPAPDWPEWYVALAPLLPDGFEHVAIQQSHQSYVQFEAFNIESSKTLHVTVSRSAMPTDPSGVTMTLADAQSEPWTDPSLEYGISLPGGRQIGLYCSFRPLPENEPRCPDLNGHRTDPETLRAFAIALATELSPDDLPARTTELDHVATSTIDAAIGDEYTIREENKLEAPHLGLSFVQHGDWVGIADYFTVRTMSGFYPPLPVGADRTSVELDGHRLTWQPIGGDTIWYVYDNPSLGVDVADEILDRAVQASSPAPLQQSSTTTANTAPPSSAPTSQPVVNIPNVGTTTVVERIGNELAEALRPDERVLVISASTTAGIATSLTRALELSGYDTLEPTSAPNGSVLEESIMYTQPGTSLATSNAIGAELAIRWEESPFSQPTPAFTPEMIDGADVIIVLGNDLANAPWEDADTPLIDPGIGRLLIVDATSTERGHQAANAQAQELRSAGVDIAGMVTATTPAEQTMLMPISEATSWTFAVGELARVGGFDTWTPTIITEPLPDDVTAALVIGDG